MIGFNTQKTKSIYEKINEEIKQKGSLSYDYEPEEVKIDESKIRFVAGLIEYFGAKASTEEKTKVISELKKFFKMPIKKAFKLFEKKFANEFSVVNLRNDIINEILENKTKYNVKNIFGLASYFIKNGTRCETIRFGLTLLATIDTSNDKEICDILKILAHCEEFTDYVIKNTYNWNEKQQQEFYFYIAKKLHGWGKISIVELLEADTEEKKEWILCHGCKNSIMYSYLGYICAQKCDLFKRLKNGNLNEEEFYGATDIMDGLIDEGPCEGMSLIEEAVDLTLYYLKHLEKYINGNIEYIDILGRINLYFQNSEFENKELIKKQIDTITQKLDLNKIIEENINQKPYESISIAKNYDIDISDKVLSIIKNDFNKHYVHCYYLFNKNKFIDELLDICDKEIDEKNISTKDGKFIRLREKTRWND